MKIITAAALAPAVTIITSTALFCSQANAQFAYQGNSMEGPYKIFIYAKESLGSGRWSFQTEAIFCNGSKPYYSDWRTADCYQSTIDGKTVPVIARSGAEFGEPDVLKAVCGYK